MDESMIAAMIRRISYLLGNQVDSYRHQFYLAKERPSTNNPASEVINDLEKDLPLLW